RFLFFPIPITTPPSATATPNSPTVGDSDCLDGSHLPRRLGIRRGRRRDRRNPLRRLALDRAASSPNADRPRWPWSRRHRPRSRRNSRCPHRQPTPSLCRPIMMGATES
ncbi:unnamed protein product, partial [Musa acuminata var. zebrina]